MLQYIFIKISEKSKNRNKDNKQTSKQTTAIPKTKQW